MIISLILSQKLRRIFINIGVITPVSGIFEKFIHK